MASRLTGRRHGQTYNLQVDEAEAEQTDVGWCVLGEEHLDLSEHGEHGEYGKYDKYGKYAK